MKWLAPLALAACACAQAPIPKLDVVPSLSELPRLFVPIQRVFPWEQILRSAAPEINFDHPAPQQIEQIKKAAAVGGYTFCKTVPLLADLKDGVYTLVAASGVERIQPNAMRVCATFEEDNNPEFKAGNFWGEIVADVPARLRSGSSGFVIHSKDSAASRVSSGADRLEASLSRQGIHTSLTLTYSHQGRTSQTVVDAQARQSLQSWYLFRQAGRLYAFTKWKGDESACATFYAVFEVGDQLTEVTLTGEECDV
jgi:hypothetical protein